MGYNDRKNWNNLLDTKCPIDNLTLIEKEKGYECPLATETRPTFKCSFFITKEKLKVMKEKIRKDKYKRRIDRPYISRLNGYDR